MKLRAIALFAALLWASSAHATTVTGTMKDIQGNLLSGAGDYATLQLMNFGSNVPRVTATNIVVEIKRYCGVPVTEICQTHHCGRQTVVRLARAGGVALRTELRRLRQARRGGQAGTEPNRRRR
jgi:hypothetical protein